MSKQKLSALVSVVLLNWNNWRDTIECLDSLLKLSYPTLEIIVVDNGSTDSSWNRIKSWANEEKLLELDYGTRQISNKVARVHLYSENHRKSKAEVGETVPEEPTMSGAYPAVSLVLIQVGNNLGFAGGCNTGMHYAFQTGAEYIWLLNNDTVVASDSLTEMVKVAGSEDRIGLTGSIIHYFHDPSSIQAYGGGSLNWWLATVKHPDLSKKSELDYISGGSLLIKRSVIETIGYLDELYFLYWEDVEYSQRALRSGWKLEVAEGSHIFHKEMGDVSDRSIASETFSVRGVILFFRDYGGLRWPFTIFLHLAGKLVNRLRRGQTDRVLPILKTAAAALWEVTVSKRER